MQNQKSRIIIAAFSISAGLFLLSLLWVLASPPSHRPVAHSEPEPRVVPLSIPESPEARKIKEAAARLQQLPEGKIVLNGPAEMQVGDTREVRANVGINVPDEILRKYIRAGDQSTEGALRVSSEMSAALTGPA